MPDCRGCGAEIQVAKTPEGESIPLERWTDSTGPHRYKIVELGPPLIVELVAESATTAAYPDHRLDCPAHGNGINAGR